MKFTALLFLAFYCVGTGLVAKKVKFTRNWNALKATYGQNGTGYHDLPWSVEEAKAQGKWQKIARDNKLNVDVFSLPEDPKLLLLFDQRGTIAGVRLALLKDDVTRKARERGYEFDFGFYDNTEKYKKDSYLGNDLWHTTVLFTNQEYLVWFGGRRTPSKDKDDVADSISMINNYDDWTFLTDQECWLIRRWGPNIEGYCIPGLGKHYFFEQVEYNGCKHWLPFFATYDQGRLVGFGMAGYGSPKEESKGANHYDNGAVPFKDMMYGVPNCMQEYIKKFGLISVHVFLTKNASKITCPMQEWNIDHCFSPKHALPFFEPFSG